jgi:hypothetical protein
MSSWRSPATFLDFLAGACSTPQFFDATSNASEWRIERPFFAVPRQGDGGLRSYENAAALHAVDLYRAIDKRTGAKTLFAKSGIPGTVGCAAASLWQELGCALTTSNEFAVWPFDGDPNVLLRWTDVVSGEIYPRTAYATALLDGPAAVRPRLFVAKTHTRVRRSAMAILRNAEWVRQLDVTIDDQVAAEANEDRPESFSPPACACAFHGSRCSCLS